ncbi:MAG TPA: apolipoprotein N-acyltransferase [Roseiarcus sp.]|nr:apolipoprotein N-acyltransferase [Roseiarcus sp.]
MSALTHPGGASLVQATAEQVVLAWGWRRRLIALCAGAAGALAMAPVNFWPAMVVPLVAAVWLIDGASQSGARRGVFSGSMASAFAVGWWWGFGYFLAGLWWLGAAFLVEADQFAWALPFGVVALPAGLAFFPAIGFAAARTLWSPGPARIFALALGLSASEWLRAVILTGFPWNEIGMALGGGLVLAQGASLVGLHGLTIATIALFAAPATLIDERRGRWFTSPIVLALAGLAVLALFGVLRLSSPPDANVSGVRLRIMQPDIGQGAEFRPENKDAIMRRYLELSDRATSPTTTGVADVTHLIWPESAFPFLLAQEPRALADIADLLHGGTTLITGAARAEHGPDDKRAHYFNSIQVVDRHGALLDRFDKSRLVPFGEYLPFRSFFDRFRLSQFVNIPGGFDAGVGGKLLHVPGVSDAWPMVCYEAVFPAEFGSALDPHESRPGWILNLTDDVWFGRTAGPYQHFEQARLRAIEQGLPLVRAANSGISAVVDGLGRIGAELPLGVDGVLDAPLPTTRPPTFYARHGAAGPAAIWIALLALCAMLRFAGARRRRRRLHA